VKDIARVLRTDSDLTPELLGAYDVGKNHLVGFGSGRHETIARTIELAEDVSARWRILVVGHAMGLMVLGDGLRDVAVARP
jgi:hypothetical protein